MQWRLLASVILLSTLVGCGRVVPPGTTVLIRKPSGETEVVEKGVYRALGRDRIYYVDRKLQSYNENDMQILCVDDINMKVDVRILLSFKANKNDSEQLEFIQAKVPAKKVTNDSADFTGFELSLDEFYKMAVQPILRNAAYEIIGKYSTDDIRENREKIAADIDALVRERIIALNFPLELSGVLLSNIDYPELVTAQRQAIKTAQLEDDRRAAIAEAEVAEAQRRVAVETELAKVRMIRAQAQADENKILTQSLTPEFLLWRQMEMLETIGPGTDMMLVPYQAITPDFMNTALIRDSLSSPSSGD